MVLGLRRARVIRDEYILQHNIMVITREYTKTAGKKIRHKKFSKLVPADRSSKYISRKTYKNHLLVINHSVDRRIIAMQHLL